MLIEAAEVDWRQVEPAIFGTLLARALDAKQRHKLGAHCTPRAYVERLVTQSTMDVGVTESVEKAPWPKTLPEQIAAVREALMASGEASPAQIARHFTRARTTSVQPLLESLAALGQATALEDGRYAA